MGTGLNDIELKLKEIKEVLTDFMLNHSSIGYERPQGDQVVCFSPEGDHSYDFLDDGGRKIQSALSESYGKYYASLQALVKDKPEDVLSKLSKLNEVVVRTIEHKFTWCKTTQQALDRAVAALDDQVKLLS